MSSDVKFQLYTIYYITVYRNNITSDHFAHKIIQINSIQKKFSRWNFPPRNGPLANNLIKYCLTSIYHLIT